VPKDIDGKSLWPTILSQKEGTHSKIFLSEFAWQAARGLRTDRYKYIRIYDSGPFTRPPRELYDLISDPDEMDNLVDTELELAYEFEKELDLWIEKMLLDREDPMIIQLRDEGLPFRKRIEKILAHFDLSWDEWRENPLRERLDNHHIRL
jgi:arylsulfatase A-like enzyme